MLVDAPGHMIVTRCASAGTATDCTLPGPGGSYALRLTAAPAAGTVVTVALVTDGQTDITPGGRIALAPVGVAGHGLYDGAVAYDAAAGTLRRADGSSWLDDGFLEGQLFQLGGGGPLFKIQALTGSDPSRVDILRVTARTSLGTVLPGSGVADVQLVQWAAVTQFDAGDWWQPVTVPVLADPTYELAPGALSTISFPKAPHLLGAIRGPLLVVGGAQAGDQSFSPAVMLPIERNGPLFGIREQPPEAHQLDVLNIFNDSAEADARGTLSATGLSGFGMGGDLGFDRTAFGEPTLFPGGISWAQIGSDPATGAFVRDAGLSTIDALNVFLGQGNDRLTVNGTPVPGFDVELDGSVGPRSEHGGLTVVHGGGAAKLRAAGRVDTTATTITRRDGLAWAEHGFAAGQEILVDGTPRGRIVALQGATMTIAGDALSPASDVERTVAVFGPPVASRARYSFSGSTISRLDAQTWAGLGFAVGDAVTLDGVRIGTVASLLLGGMSVAGAAFGLLPTTREANVAVFDPTLDNVRTGGNLITVTGGAGAGPSGAIPALSGDFEVTAHTLRTGGARWRDAGFAFGQVVRIGLQALWTVVALEDDTLTLSGPALAAGTLVGETVMGFAPSPLVVFGGTSQDGVWYSGDQATPSARDFAGKPYPSTLGNGTPRFVFPVATAYRLHGNDVVDASGLYAAAHASQVPEFGLTIYGGAGDDTIRGSRARDLLFGGGGIDAITGADVATGDVSDVNAGVNVDVVTRALAFATWNRSHWPTADPLREVHGLVPQILRLSNDLFAAINGTVPLVPTVPPVTVAAGTTPPPKPSIRLDARDEAARDDETWTTHSRHPRFVVTPALLTALPYFADGEIGLEVRIYLDGELVTREPLADGRYTVTVELVDRYGMVSEPATASRELVVDGTAGGGGGGGEEPAASDPGSGELLGIVTETTQITVPGGVETGSLPYATELAPWVSPATVLLQSATAQPTADLLQAIGATGVGPPPTPVQLAEGVVSPIDLDPLIVALRDALAAREALPPLPAPLPPAPDPVRLPPLSAPLPPLPPGLPHDPPSDPPPTDGIGLPGLDDGVPQEIEIEKEIEVGVGGGSVVVRVQSQTELHPAGL